MKKNIKKFKKDYLILISIYFLTISSTFLAITK